MGRSRQKTDAPAKTAKKKLSAADEYDAQMKMELELLCSKDQESNKLVDFRICGASYVAHAHIPPPHADTCWSFADWILTPRVVGVTMRSTVKVVYKDYSRVISFTEAKAHVDDGTVVRWNLSYVSNLLVCLISKSTFTNIPKISDFCYFSTRFCCIFCFRKNIV